MCVFAAVMNGHNSGDTYLRKAIVNPAWLKSLPHKITGRGNEIQSDKMIWSGLFRNDKKLIL